MVKSSETQKLFEARNKVLSAFFLAKMNCTFRNANRKSFVFYDKISKKLIRLNKSIASKQELINKLGIVRKSC